MMVIDGCVLCGQVDEDIELGWTVCGQCFRPDGPVLDYPDIDTVVWPTVAKTAALVMFVVALLFLAMAVGKMTAQAEPTTTCGIDAADVCGGYGKSTIARLADREGWWR